MKHPNRLPGYILIPLTPLTPDPSPDVLVPADPTADPETPSTQFVQLYIVILKGLEAYCTIMY